MDDDIWEFSRDGDIIILGDFNARTAHHQTVFYDTSEEMLRELDVAKMDLSRLSQAMEHRVWTTRDRHGDFTWIGHFELLTKISCFRRFYVFPTQTWNQALSLVSRIALLDLDLLVW